MHKTDVTARPLFAIPQGNVKGRVTFYSGAKTVQKGKAPDRMEVDEFPPEDANKASEKGVEIDRMALLAPDLKPNIFPNTSPEVVAGVEDLCRTFSDMTIEPQIDDETPINSHRDQFGRLDPHYSASVGAVQPYSAAQTLIKKALATADYQSDLNPWMYPGGPSIDPSDKYETNRPESGQAFVTAPLAGVRRPLPLEVGDDIARKIRAVDRNGIPRRWAVAQVRVDRDGDVFMGNAPLFSKRACIL